jgi:putative toxin-antitoxin system antitoxin component (TIGR02293 family)
MGVRYIGSAVARIIDKTDPKEKRPKRAESAPGRKKSASRKKSRFRAAERTRWGSRDVEAPRTDIAPELLSRAIQVFGSRLKAVEWLNSHIAALGGRVPASMTATKSDQQKVYDELGRIEHGVF